MLKFGSNFEWKIAKAVLEHSDECTFVDYFHDSRHITAYNERVLKYACFASLIENKKVMPRDLKTAVAYVELPYIGTFQTVPRLRYANWCFWPHT